MKKIGIVTVIGIICLVGMASCSKVDLPRNCTYCSKCNGTGYEWPRNASIPWSLIPGKCNWCSGKGYFYNTENDLSGYGNGLNFSGRLKNSCNKRKHKCSGGIDLNRDGWCDNCWDNGYRCSMADHQPL